MNKKRREKIQNVINNLENCWNDLDEIKNDENDAKDSVPINLQNSESYHFLEDCCDKLDDATSNVREAINDLGKIVEE